MQNSKENNLNLNLEILISNFQNRSKIFSHTEVLAYSHIPTNRTKNVIDPLWSYTQSGKNYLPNKYQTILQHYLDPSFFEPKYDYCCWSNRMVDLTSTPRWAYFVKNNDWFWKQLRAYKIAVFLRCLPGIKNIYICGSTTMEISNSESDIDFAIQTYKYQLLLARFWTKLSFKLANLDNHTIKNSIKQLLAHWGFLDSNIVNQGIYKDRKKHAQRNTDCGLFFVNEEQIIEYFGLHEKQLSILSKSLILFEYNEENIDTPSLNSLSYYNNLSPIQVKICQFVRILLYLISIPLSPLIFFQLAWYKLKTTGKEDHCLKPNFSSFYQRNYESKKITLNG